MILSVVTINYNNLAGLKLTADSVMSQSMDLIEWIVIDGASTDGSAEFLDSIKDNIDYLVSESDRGIYDALNKGMAHANGDYVIFLNSGDTFADSHVVADFVTSAPKADIVCGDTVMIKNGEPHSKKIHPENISLLYFYNNNLNHQSIFFSSKSLQGRSYDLRWSICSDRHLILSLLLDGASYAHWHRYVAVYDIGGLSSVHVGRRVAEAADVINTLIPEIVRKDYDEMVKMRDVDLSRWTMEIIHGPRWLRFITRIVLYPLTFVTRGLTKK